MNFLLCIQLISSVMSIAEFSVLFKTGACTFSYLMTMVLKIIELVKLLTYWLPKLWIK